MTAPTAKATRIADLTARNMDEQNTEQPQRKKRARPYSRRGCQRCKRMKVKCDELLPRCARCSKSDAVCDYPVVEVLSFMSTSTTPQSSGASERPKHSPSEESNESMDKGLLELLDDDLSSQMDKAIHQNVEGFQGPTPLPSTITRLQVNTELLIPMYSDANGAVKSTESTSPRNILLTDTIYHFPPDCFHSLDIDPSHKRYLDLFYTEFSEILMPLRYSDEANTIRDILLQYSLRKDYLYYAVLSSGARLSYKRTKLSEDERYFTRFLQKTSEMLSDYKYIQTHCNNPTPTSQTEQVQKIVSEVLEPLLLTILLLTSDNASSMRQSWRGHLRGAKELLQRVFVDHKFPQTKILIFCKCWFTLFEVLAGLSAPLGGTLVRGSTSQINRLLKLVSWGLEGSEETRALKELKMVTEDGFIFIFGIHHGLLPPLVKLIEMMRSTNSPQPHSGEIFGLIAQFQRARDFHMAPSNQYDQDTVLWFECFHQSFVDGALLSVLTRFLQVTTSPSSVNPVIQELVHSILSRTSKLLSSASTTKTQFKLMMDQWPLLTAGLYSVTPEDRCTVENLFQLLTGLGSGSAKYSLQKIKRAWSKSSGFTTEPVSGSEEIDIVTY